jgi:hypothetical protein
MSKELYIAAHEELIGRYLEDHPEASEAEAYDLCADRAYDHMVDKLADRADNLRKERQENGYASRYRRQLEATEDTCGDCGVGAGEHDPNCERLAGYDD